MGPRHAASFTDATSLPNAGFSVSIQAQVIPDRPYNWYFFLKSRVPQHLREFKKEAVQVFFDVTEAERESALKTLTKVRINIADPRPYTANVEEALAKLLPKGVSSRDFLHRLDDSTRHLKDFQQQILRAVAERMLFDSPSERLKTMFKMWQSAVSVRSDTSPDHFDPRFDKKPEPPPTYDLTHFEHRKSNILSNIAKFTSASASVFTPAIEQLEEAIYSPMASSIAITYVINNALAPSHAFDQGNEKAVKWIADRRADVLSEIDQDQYFYPATQPEPLQELVSSESIPLQAADIAAAIARRLWERSSLVAVVRAFEYVTYNGERLSEDQAAWYQKILSPR